MKIDLLEKLFSFSKADSLIIIKGQEDYSNIRFANNTITSSGHVKDASYTFISIIKGRIGVFSVDNIENEEDTINAIKKSEEIAEQNEVSDEVFELVRDDKILNELDNKFSLSYDLKSDDYTSILSQKIGNVFSNLVGYNNSGFGEVKTGDVFLATSKGVRRYYKNQYSYLAVTSKTKDFKKSVWHGQSGRDIEEIEEEEIISNLRRDFNYSNKSFEIDPGRYDVILSPSVVADFLMYYFWMSSLRDSEEGRGVFSKFSNGNLVGTYVGEKLFPDYINLYSDPNSKISPSIDFIISSGNSSFASIFDNGAKQEKKYWIKNGVLTNLITTRKYAHEKGMKDFALYPSNILMDGSNKGFEEIIKDTKKGLFINCIWYVRLVDPTTGLLTGLTRDGVYIIEDGEIKGACNNFRFNESPIELLKNTTDISKLYRTLPREFDEEESLLKLPYLKVRDFNMSTVSEAI